MEEWIREITVDMIPDGLWRQIAEEIGAENLVKLTKLVGGTNCYFPKADTLLKPIRDANIKREYNGYNARVLARRYNLTERWVKEILDNNGVCEGQMNMVDMITMDNQ